MFYGCDTFDVISGAIIGSIDDSNEEIKLFKSGVQ